MKDLLRVDVDHLEFFQILEGVSKRNNTVPITIVENNLDVIQSGEKVSHFRK